jgi:hypothetical protein
VGDDLARKLFEALLANTPDVDLNLTPTWEQLHYKDRETWEAVAIVARKHLLDRTLAELQLIALGLAVIGEQNRVDPKLEHWYGALRQYVAVALEDAIAMAKKQPFRAGDVVEITDGQRVEEWTIAVYDAERDEAWIAGWPETLVSNATACLRLTQPATDDEHARMIADIERSEASGRRAALKRVQERGGTP